MKKTIIIVLTLLGAVSNWSHVGAEETLKQDGSPGIVPPGLVVNFAVGPLTENDVYLPKYQGEIPYKATVRVFDSERRMLFWEPSVHVYLGREIVRRKTLQDGREIIWKVELSVDGTRADAFFQISNANEIVLSQSIAVHLPPR